MSAETQLLQDLKGLGLDRDSYRAIALLPLVQVAWADRKVQAQERKAILQFADGNDLLQGKGKEVVQEWLTHCPDDAFFELGRSVLVRLAHKRRGIGREFQPETVDNIVEFCSVVAEAAGGVFGMFWQTSTDEQRAIKRIAGHIDSLHETESPNRGIVGRTISTDWQDILDQFKTSEIDLSPEAKRELFGDG